MSRTLPEHILLLGASGNSGLAFIKHHLTLANSDPIKPYLTLYIRHTARAKLTSNIPIPVAPEADLEQINNALSSHKIRIFEGSLTALTTVFKALSASSTAGDSSFPGVTAVISLLGAYMSLYHFITRTTPTPITDAIQSVWLPTMASCKIQRILVLSTPSSFPVVDEARRMSWGWWLWNLAPKIVVPQGGAEMKGLAEAVMQRSETGETSSSDGLESTVVRVGLLTDGSAEKEVRAFILGGMGGTENRTLTRESMSKWLLEEVGKKEWVGKAPVLCNMD